MTYKRPVRVLFLCTGNSCRSQIAEGLANALGKGKLEARSAGIKAHGKNPRAIATMRELGIDISHQESQVFDDQMLNWADLVITVCSSADQHCPVLPAHVQKKHWPFPDPAKAQGSDAQIESVFREVRDQILTKIQGMIGGLALWENQNN
ncbi:MAG: arsenate reductase ArsC [Gammaproteobacteria bacterium]|nr:arsenate reductase ArsC [Gammaproteobacteria bacterium]